MSWENLVSAANEAKAKTHIYGNHYLDEQYPKKAVIEDEYQLLRWLDQKTQDRNVLGQD